MKLLLHTCCAPCSVYCIDELRGEGIEPTVYWFNPNIHPYMEYKARRDCLKEYAKTHADTCISRCLRRKQCSCTRSHDLGKGIGGSFRAQPFADSEQTEPGAATIEPQGAERLAEVSIFIGRQSV